MTPEAEVSSVVKPVPEGQLKKMNLWPIRPEATVTIGAMEPAEEQQFMKFLKQNDDIFAWSPNDLKGVPRELMEHSLHTSPKIKPKKRKLRKLAEERIQGSKR